MSAVKTPLETLLRLVCKSVVGWQKDTGQSTISLPNVLTAVYIFKNRDLRELSRRQITWHCIQ